MPPETPEPFTANGTSEKAAAASVAVPPENADRTCMDGYEFATTASRKRSRVIPRRGDAKDDSDAAATPPSDHGGWMIAGRRERRKPTHMLPQQGVEMATPIGSRFSALADATEDGPKAPAAPAAPAAEPVAPTQPTNTAPNQNQSVPAKQRRRGPKKGAGTGVVKITQAKDGAAQSPGAATSTGLPKHGPGRPRKEPTATPGIMNQNQQPEFPAGWEVLFGSGDRDLQGSLPKSSQITKILQKDVRIETAEPMQETPTPPTITCQPTSQLDSEYGQPMTSLVSRKDGDGMWTGSLSGGGRGRIESNTSYGWWRMTGCLQTRSGGSGRGRMMDRVRDVDILRRQSCMCCETVPPR
ncbi:hypothetical protein LINPERHAP1_LOCUS23665 [Linum perenne]